MPSVGYDPANPDQLYTGVSLGGRVWLRKFFIDLESSQMTRTLPKYDEHHVDLRHRLLVGYEVLPWLGVFAGGGAKHELRTRTPFEQRLKPDFSVGVQVF
jgi:hypothetical protein